MATAIVPRLAVQYENEILPELKKDLGRENALSLPRLQKIVISMGVGQAVQDRKVLEEVVGHLTMIAGQKPEVTRAKKSVAGFKLREGMEIGARVTLRRTKMYEFLDRLISIVLPRVRDFRGLNPGGFDSRGNYNFGLTEQVVFPEVDPDSVKNFHGMNITMCFSTDDDDESRLLLKKFGFPFKKQADPKKKKSATRRGGKRS